MFADSSEKQRRAAPSHALSPHQTNRAGADVDLHAAAGGNLAPVSEPGDLRPGEAVYPRRVDESALTLGYSLRPLALHKTTHVLQKGRHVRGGDKEN